MGKLTTKLIVSIGLLTVCFSAFLYYRTYKLTDRRISAIVEQQASIALQFNLAIRGYVGTHIRPAMYELLGKDEFVRETMSTSYVSRSVFEEVRRKFPDYIIKFSSDNPRNPVNQAGPEELEIIKHFNANPAAKRWTGEITIQGKQYLAKFSARRMKTSCLRCHGDPADAPASLIAQYGSVAGFHRPLGEVIGLDTVAIPVASVKSSLLRQSFRTYIASAMAVLLLFALITLVLRFFVTRRLAHITRHFADAAHQTDCARIEPIPVRSGDEIDDLALSFNTLSARLKDFYTSLEMKVSERTAELENVNANLRQEIEERQKAQHALQLTQFAIDHYSDPAFWMGPDARFIYVNEASCKKLGYTRQELLQMTVHDIDPVFTKKVWPQHWEELRQQRTMTIESLHKTKAGHIFPVEINIDFFSFEGNEYNFAFVRDISGQKAAELEKAALEKRLQRAHKMEALGTLAGGVAHDLNNILSGIVSYPELLLLDLPENSPLRHPLITVKKSGEKAAQIVQDLLTLARRGVATTEVVNVNRIIRNYLNSPEFAKLKDYHPHCRVTTRLEDHLLHIMGSPVHLSKTIMNLVSNAAEAMQEKGEITIVTKNQYVDEPVRGYDDIAEGDYVVVTITDPGAGIIDQDLDRIFEPFYTKKVMGRSGTGLGRAVVWGTVKDHNGYIDVQSEENRGTAITLYFPVTRKAVIDQQPAVTLAEIAGAGERVLVVDDMAAQREIASNILKKLGYQVDSVASGEAAVEYLRQHRTDVVILDMIMAPGMDGLETYRQILAVKPAQKAIIASGFSETDRVKQAQALGAGAYIRKPYSIEKIGLALKRELGK